MGLISCRSAALGAAAACAVACAVRAPHADAQEQRGAPARAAVSSTMDERLLVRLGYGVTWDDNVFRLPDNAPDPEAGRGVPGKSDRYSTASIGLHANLPFSMQRVLLDLSRAAVRYEKFSSRDQDPFSYSGEWRWSLTPRLTGALTAARSETRVDVEDVEGRRSIDQHLTRRGGTIDAWLFGGWHVLGSAQQSDTTYSEVFLARPDTTQRTTELGLRYQWPSNSQVTATRRWRRGTETVTDAAALGGSDFTQDDTEVTASWIPSGKSTLSGRVTRMNRHNELFPQRDFEATSGELRHIWRPTGKLTTDLSATRNVEPYNLTLESTTLVDDTAAAVLTLTLSDQSSLETRASRRKSSYGNISTSFVARRDVTDAIELRMRWAPRRYLSFDARLRHEERTSTDERQTFDNNVASVNMELRF